MTVSRAKAERGLRDYGRGIPAYGKSGPIRHGCADHVHRREGDEMACRCGKRWSIGEDHPQ